MLAAAPHAAAATVTTNVFSQYGTGQSRAIDLNNDGGAEFQIDAQASPTPLNFSGVSVVNPAPAVQFVSDGTFISALTSGAAIGPSSTFGNASDLYKIASGTPSGNWPNDILNPRYVGVQFEIGGAAHYGWALVSTGVTDNSASFRLYQYAYETEARTAIQTPAYADFTPTPEPSTFGLLALGAAGVAVLRRRRAA